MITGGSRRMAPVENWRESARGVLENSARSD
jgi:hypothetical protein